MLLLRKVQEVLSAQNSHGSSTDCPVTRHGQSGNLQDSNTVLVFSLYLKHSRKNEKSSILAGLNESFPGAE